MPALGDDHRMDRDAVPEWLRGQGEMARRIRTHEWGATPLGPIEDWAVSLKFAVDTLLSGGFPMVALWGPDLIQIYNDDYRDLMGVKHPVGLGQPTRECWPEVWHINAPIYERVLAGETVRIEEGLYPITRSGVLEDAWFTLAYSPLRDEAGAIAGVLVTVFETSDQVLAARDSAAQKAFVLALSDALRPLGDAEGIQREACRLLGAELGVDRVFYAEIDDREGCGRVRSEYLGGDAPSMTGRHDYATFPWVIADCEPTG